MSLLCKFNWFSFYLLLLLLAVCCVLFLWLRRDIKMQRYRNSVCEMLFFENARDRLAVESIGFVVVVVVDRVSLFVAVRLRLASRNNRSLLLCFNCCFPRVSCCCSSSVCSDPICVPSNLHTHTHKASQKWHREKREKQHIVGQLEARRRRRRKKS